VLATFLRQLGVAATAVPDSDDERGALYRSLLADRRVLVLLDDAKDAAHVRPLIPGGSGCAVLITTRNRLNGLAGAAHLDLDTLTRPESHTLLTRVIGRQRTEAEPQATQALLDLCAHLPLAIRLAGARLASRPQWRIQDLADRLTTSRRRLDELHFADQGVRACFDISYNALSAEPGRDGLATRAPGPCGCGW
jgi:hypothetical protein